jgi:hypothetical protein
MRCEIWRDSKRELEQELVHMVEEQDQEDQVSVEA